MALKKAKKAPPKEAKETVKQILVRHQSGMIESTAQRLLAIASRVGSAASTKDGAREFDTIQIDLELMTIREKIERMDKHCRKYGLYG